MSTLILALCLATLAGDDGAPTWERERLSNGLDVSCLLAEHSPSQAFFTLLPTGLLLDGPGEAQFSHLLEHLAIRTTDAQGLVGSDGVQVNGETMATTLRLETLAPAEAWQAALARHGSWLGAEEVDGEVLERTRADIAQELSTTVASGFSHKWALAAWNQVVRHGRPHAALTGDLAVLEPARAARELRRRIRPTEGTRLVSVGPVPLDEVRAELERVLGGLPLQALPDQGATLSLGEVLEPGDREATWDLPASHYLEWYPVPPDERSRVRADALARLLNVRIDQRAGLRREGFEVLASAELVVPEGRFLVISASFPGERGVAEVQEALAPLVQGLADQAEAPVLATQAASQAGEWPDFEALRARAAGRPGLDWIEAQQALFVVYAELATGLERRELARVYGTIDWSGQAEATADWLTPSRRSTLVLRPER